MINKISKLENTNKIESQICDVCGDFRYKIKCYVDHRSRNETQETYDAGTDDLQAQLEVAIQYLRDNERQYWQRPKATKMNKCDYFQDFFEIRFKANNLQQRPIGYFGPNSNEFTILLWATEKGNKLDPQSWCKKAYENMQKIISGNATTTCLRFNGDKKCSL